MKTVYKYPVPLGDFPSIVLPRGAEILTVAMQFGYPQLWALVDPEQPGEVREFRLAGTGHPLPDGKLRYISTFQANDGALVLHFFEMLKGRET